MRKAVFELAFLLILLIFFQPAGAEEIIYIMADGSIEPSTAPIHRAGNAYTLTKDVNGSIFVEGSGIVIDGSGHTLRGSGRGTGISLYGKNVTIRNIRIRNFGCGIHLIYSSGNNITGNEISGNGAGIRLWRSSGNSILRNDISSNEYGMEMDTAVPSGIASAGSSEADSSNNSVVGNKIADNGCGLRIWHSSNNSFYHNTFINNSRQVESLNSTNVWDNGYPSGGNYWSDYSGRDANGDGIGDTPYVIDAGNVDRYPLMRPNAPAPGASERADVIPILAAVIIAVMVMAAVLRRRR